MAQIATAVDPAGFAREMAETLCAKQDFYEVQRRKLAEAFDRAQRPQQRETVQ